MSTKEFESAWADLSCIQREAAEWDAGALLVLAGPGSGKTRVLTCRIARLLDSNAEENFRILGLTFTNKAADEMRARVESFVPGQTARVFLGTFHSFCADVLRQHGTHIGINPDFKIYSQDTDLGSVLAEAIKGIGGTPQASSQVYRRQLGVIDWLKSRMVSPEETAQRFSDREKGERVAAAYAAYESVLSDKNALDFNSLLMKVYQLLTKFPNLAKRYRTVYRYLCVDEFQDANLAQYLVIRALTGSEYANLFVVADDDQIIYQWNGASHKRIETLISDFSPNVIQLPTVYRCPAEVVELANNLIRHNFFRRPDKEALTAACSPSTQEVIRVLEFSDLGAESSGIAQDILDRHSPRYDSIAILARSRKLLDSVECALRVADISAVIAQRKDEFASTPFVWLHSLLKLTNDRQSEANLQAVCGSFSQLTGTEIDPEEIAAEAEAGNGDLLQHWTKRARATAKDELASEAVEAVGQFLGEGRAFRDFHKFALTWFDKVLLNHRESGHDPSEEIFARYDEERVVWNDLTREIELTLGEAPALEAFLQELQMRSKESPPKPNTVVLMTIHGAKGKEFEHVYLMGLVEDELPSYQSKKKGDRSPEMEEERRNCFVAITRAQETLTLSYAEQYRGWRKDPSRFLFEMGLLTGPNETASDEHELHSATAK
jgi:DNA helicase-2/ATP-dependent DNA helicase PcrA